VTLKVLNKYLEDYVSRQGDLENPLPSSKKEFVEIIECHYQIIKAIFTDLAKYMEQINTVELKDKTLEEIDLIADKETFGKKETHTEHVKLRLTLIGNMIEESTSILKL
jgi:hypothetical protein